MSFSKHLGPENLVWLTEYHLDAGILMLAKSCHCPDTAGERGGRAKKRVQTQTYFSSFPSLLNINQMQCWALVRGMKRQKSTPCDDEPTTSEVPPHLASAVQVFSHPQGTGLAMAHDKVTQVPTSLHNGTNRDTATEASLYPNENLQLPDVLKPQQMPKHFAE